MSKNYGYKVCCRKQGKRRYMRRFLTYTHKDAINMMSFYIRYPPRDLSNNKLVWKVLPITLSEVNAGIWRESPF